MSKAKKQTAFFRGIYEFEDPSGTLIAAKIPPSGTADLFSDTAVIVRPNQSALFIYKGQIADTLAAGVHMLKTASVPVLTKLANWKWGFQNPLRCEIIFFSSHAYTGRRWGTPQPILLNIREYGTVPIRAFGNFNVEVKNPIALYHKLIGTRAAYSVTDLEEFVQGQIIELLPQAFSDLQNLSDLSSSHDDISKKLEKLLNREIAEFGIAVHKIQVLSALPSQEVIEALDAKAAIEVIGSQKEYLLYKAASSLGPGKDTQSNDPLQMMMGLMLGKGLLGADYHEKEAKVAIPVSSRVQCLNCDKESSSDAKFCSHCGKRIL